MCYWDYYGSLLSGALSQAYSVAKLEDLPLTLLLAVLGAVCFVAWKIRVDREQNMIKDWKAYAFAAIMPILIVVVGRFIWNMATEIPARQQRAVRALADLRQTDASAQAKLKDQISSLNDQIRDLKDQLHNQAQACKDDEARRAARLSKDIDAIEASNFPQRLFDAKATLESEQTRLQSVEAEYDNCRKTNPQAMGCPGLFGNMQRVEQEQGQHKTDFEAAEASLNSQLNGLRNY